MSSSKPFSPTPEQVAIAQALKKPGNLAIDAGAGTGKSSTLHYLVREHLSRHESTLMCVFNARNKQELDAKLREQGLTKAFAKTFAGMAYSAFTKKYNIKGNLDVDTQKYRRMARWWVGKNLPLRSKEQAKEAVKFLGDVLQMFLCNITRHHESGDLVIFLGGSLNDPDSTIPYSLDVARSIAYIYDLYLDYDDVAMPEGYDGPGIDELIAEDTELLLTKGITDLVHLGRMSFNDPKTAADILVEDAKPLYEGMSEGKVWVDFLDMQVWCVIEKWSVWRSINVLVDEAQDLSPLERALVDMHVDKGRGRVIIVGDPAQAIYAFKGADNDGFSNSQIFWRVKSVKPLSVCWRCCKKVVDLASGWKEGFTPAPHAIEGVVAVCNDEDVLKLIKDGDAIISRMRSAMIGWWRKLIKAGIPAKIIGSNPADVIVRLLEKISVLEGFKFEDLQKHLSEYQTERVAKMEAKNRTELEIMNFVDEIDTVKAMCEDVEAKSLDELIGKIRDELDPRKMPYGGVSIMTGHGAKGGEWPQVFNVTPDRFPLKYAGQSQAQFTQEMNLTYVMQTRAMKALFSVDPKAKPYDASKPQPVAKPTSKPSSARAWSSEWGHQEFDDDFEIEDVPSYFGMGEVPEMGRYSPAGETVTITVEPVPADVLPAATPVLLLPATTLSASELAPLTLPIAFDTGALATFKGEPVTVVQVEGADRRVEYDHQPHTPPYRWVKAVLLDERQPVAHQPQDDEADLRRAEHGTPAYEGWDKTDEERVIDMMPAPVAPVVIQPAPVPEYKATGNLKADMQAVKAHSQERLFGVIRKLSLKDAQTLHDLLNEYINEQKELAEAELEPA